MELCNSPGAGTHRFILLWNTSVYFCNVCFQPFHLWLQISQCHYLLGHLALETERHVPFRIWTYNFSKSFSMPSYMYISFILFFCWHKIQSLKRRKDEDQCFQMISTTVKNGVVSFVFSMRAVTWNFLWWNNLCRYFNIRGFEIATNTVTTVVKTWWLKILV